MCAKWQMSLNPPRLHPPEQIKQRSWVAHLVQKYNREYSSNTHAHTQTKSSLSIAGRSPPRWSGWRGMKEREPRTADVRPRFSQRLASEGKRWRGGGRRRGLNKQQKNDSH